MIAELQNNLVKVISDLEIAITRQFHVMSLQENYAALKNNLDEYANNPSVLYRELFERWCEYDIVEFYRGVELLLSKEDCWQEASIRLLPDFASVVSLVCEIADEIEQRREDLIADINRTQHTGASPEGLILPRELDTDRARKYFARAIERGFILPTSTGFEWVRATKKGEGVNTLIALLGGMIFCGDEVINSRYGDKWKLGDGGIFPDEELKQLFGVKSLGAIRTNGLDSSRQKTAPRGWSDIVELFED